MTTTQLAMTTDQFRALTVRLARSQVGYAEGTGYGGRSNYTKYWADLHPAFQGNAWCGGFTTWVFEKLTGVNPRDSFNSFFTPSIVSFAKRVGAWKTSNPKPGDWCLMAFPGGNFVDHVGITALGNTNIEGNTSPGNSGSQANGGGVYVRRRPASQIAGWVDLVSLATALNVEFVGPTQPTETLIKPTGKMDEHTATVAQVWLNSLRADKIKRGKSVRAWPQLEVDGDFGPISLKALQAAVGADPDGDFGPLSAKALAEYLKSSRSLDETGLSRQLIRDVQGYLNVLVAAKAL